MNNKFHSGKFQIKNPDENHLFLYRKIRDAYKPEKHLQLLDMITPEEPQNDGYRIPRKGERC